jgi:hypothetical protein
MIVVAIVASLSTCSLSKPCLLNAGRKASEVVATLQEAVISSTHIFGADSKLEVGNVQASAKADGDDLDRDPRSAVQGPAYQAWYNVVNSWISA